MSRASFVAGLVFSVVVPTLFLGAAFAACGVGHGDCRLMILAPVLFPFAILFSQVFPNSIVILLILALGQFPLYVVILAASQRRGSQRLVRNLLIAAHGVAVVLAFIFW